MKIMISYPPLETGKGTPLLGQNRQFQWFNNPSYIYPVVPATAATLLKEKGYDVVWNDAIAEGWSHEKFLEFFERETPDLIAIETKTPVVKMHWRIIGNLKKINSECIAVLFGDHVTALPEESMRNSKVDYVLTGGDYDFLLLNLCNHLTKNEGLEPGIWLRKNGRIRNTGKFALKHDLNSLPFIDRKLTKWQLYKVNGNFKHLPGTYIMSGRDCWYHKCKFCSWPTLYPRFRVRSVRNVLDEIGLLIKHLGIREIMDDTGTFPVGKWLEDFCKGMIERGYNGKISIDCNMRANALNQEQYNLMAKAGFRLVLYGLESGNQKTLDRLDKGTKVDDITNACRAAANAGLSPHLTAMVGYPWETKEDAERSVSLAKEIFKNSWADTLQATIVIPYPGTRLFAECKAKGLLKTEDWERYDMREPVIKSPLSEAEIKELTQKLYKSFASPKYVLKKLASVRTADDARYVLRAAKAVLGHLKDFAIGGK